MLSAGGAVAGPMAAGALVGIGAAALTGGAVLDAVGFPHSPEKVNGRQAMMLLPTYWNAPFNMAWLGAYRMHNLAVVMVTAL